MVFITGAADVLSNISLSCPAGDEEGSSDFVPGQPEGSRNQPVESSELSRRGSRRIQTRDARNSLR